MKVLLQYKWLAMVLSAAVSGHIIIQQVSNILVMMTMFAHLFALTFMLVPYAKTSEFASLTELNKDEIIFERENYLLFLFAMTTEDTKV